MSFPVQQELLEYSQSDEGHEMIYDPVNDEMIEDEDPVYELPESDQD